MLWRIVALLFCVKLLLLPAYRSTDFEVHRNWLAITHSLPIEKWYTDETSEWTLDYPPFFAYFEYFLSKIAVYFDPKMLSVSNLNYSSPGTVLFQRLSVIVTDFMLVYGTKECADYIKTLRFQKCSRWSAKWDSPSTILHLTILGNVGLLIIDHIHFQYNGILFGILLLSVSKILRGQYIAGAIWFSVLLNMKHIFLYMVPAYVVYLLRNYCMVSKNFNDKSLVRLTKLACVVITVCSMSFGPFIVMGQLPQVLGRLFPFKRGLSHAYWAPNVWAIYNTLDKAAVLIGRGLGFKMPHVTGSMTSGLVKEYSHTVLPSITPVVTMIATITAIMPCLWKLWRSPGNPLHFIRSLVLCSSCAFLFGWHVHEKAILMVIIPLSLTAIVGRKEAESFVFLATVGHYSLLPLVFTSPEILLKFLMYLLYTIYVFKSFSGLFGQRTSQSLVPISSTLEIVYLAGLVPLFLYENVFHWLLRLDVKYPFLPLLLTSVYCSLGIVYGIFKYYYFFLSMDRHQHKQKTF